MNRLVSAAVLALFAIAPLAAQAPKGWMVRADRSTSASDPDGAGSIKFMAMGSSFHAINPSAAVYWNPTHTASGNYVVKGTFKLLKPSGHPNYYGLVFGGSDLEGPAQNYLYFVVAQNGMWLIKHREGDATTHDVVARTANDVVKQPDASGTSTNALEVRVMTSKIDFVVNGSVVHSAPRAGLLLKTDGIYGIRVNHQLEVQIDSFAMTK